MAGLIHAHIINTYVYTIVTSARAFSEASIHTQIFFVYCCILTAGVRNGTVMYTRALNWTQAIIIVPGALGGCTCEVLNCCTARTKKYKNVHMQPAVIIAGASFGGSGDCEGLYFASVIVINPQSCIYKFYISLYNYNAYNR